MRCSPCAKVMAENPERVVAALIVGFRYDTPIECSRSFALAAAARADGMRTAERNRRLCPWRRRTRAPWHLVFHPDGIRHPDGEPRLVGDRGESFRSVHQHGAAPQSLL